MKTVKITKRFFNAEKRKYVEVGSILTVEDSRAAILIMNDVAVEEGAEHGDTSEE